MANASVENVTKTIETTVDEEVVQLTLNPAEARALWALAGLVWSGDGDGTYAREARAIKGALYDTGKIGYVYEDDYFYVDDDQDLRAKARKSADK